jgi:putative membrane protein
MTPPKPVEKPLTDSEIVAVTSAANMGEIEMGRLAAKNASSPEVKNFAAMLVTQHTDMESKSKTVATKQKIMPVENDASTAMKTDTSSMIGTLKNQKGKDFDKEYVDSQVKTHREVLATLDNKLIPNAQNLELKTLLNEARSHIAAHLAKAEEIQQKLESGGPTTPAKPMPKK